MKADICANRHKGNQESVEANEATAPGKKALRLQVEALFVLAGPRGLTSEEAEDRLGLPHQTVSPRLTELKVRGYLRPGERRMTRSGCFARALVHMDYWEDSDA